MFCLHFQAEKEKKKQEQLDKKQLKKKLLEEEEQKVGGKARGTMAPPPKVTRAQAEEVREKRQQLELAAASASTSKPSEVQVPEQGLEENPNQLLKQSALEGEAVARGVDSAIALLGGGEPVELHPEKRMKAAYASFEEKELPRLKAENPNLRLSQLKQLLRKEWQKSPDNPMNQVLAATSDSA